MSRGREEPSIITAIWEARDCHDRAAALFLEDDGVIDEDEADLLDSIDDLYCRLEGINLARLVSRSIEDRSIDVNDPEQIAAIGKLANPHSIRRISDYRRDIEPKDAA